MWLVSVVIRRYIDILIIIITFPYSTCIRSFFGSSILTSLFIFKMFFRSFIIIDRGEGQGTAEVNGAEPSAMVVEKDVVGPSAMVVESDSVGPSPMVTEVGRYAQSSRPDGQLSQHL